jgi:tripartite-type tricarboxylate transporter receptor subunit TctC
VRRRDTTGLTACLALIASAGLCGGSIGALAQTTATPAGQLTIVVGFGAGGSADSIARIVGTKLGERLGQKVVIENRPGAGANLAARQVIAAPADGSTLLVTTAALPINNTLYKNKGFDIADLQAVSICATTPEALAVNKSNPAKTLKEFIANNQGKRITFSTAGVGTGSHIVADYFFKTIAKIDAAHVPHKSGPDATNALLGGHVDLLSSSLSGFTAQINSGAVTGIAIATEKRFPVVQQVPTYAESGFPGLVWSSWAGFFASSKVPAAVVERQAAAIAAILKEKDVNDRLVAIGFAPMSGTKAESAQFFRREIDEWGKMVRALGLSVE